MPKRPDDTFPIPEWEVTASHVLDLLGGTVRARPLSGEEALAALEKLQADAKAGDAKAATRWGHYLIAHQPESESNRTAIRAFRMSHKKGLADGTFFLGLMLLRGQGTAQNKAKAIELLEPIAFAGHQDAQALLVKAYAQGASPLGPEAKQSLYWARIAGAGGVAWCAREAGLFYRDGFGTDVDLVAATEWLTKGAQAGDRIAQYEVARLFENRHNPKADALEAKRWQREAALNGEVNAQYRLGLACWAGRGETVDLREAVRWMARAAEGGDTRAMVTLAGFMQTGNALPLDRFKALVLLKAANARGDATAKAGLPGLEKMLTFREKRSAAKLLRQYPDIRALVETLLPRHER